MKELYIPITNYQLPKKKQHRMWYMMSGTSKGFTLVELLVVIAIIGVLSALIMTNLVGVRQRARDAQRKSDIRQIQSALELYRSDAGSYPDTTGYTTCGTLALTNAGWVIDTTNKTIYMKSIPCDPSGANSGTYNNGIYYYSSTGSTYNLGACIENGSDTDKNVTSSNPGGTGTCSSGKYYVVTNP